MKLLKGDKGNIDFANPIQLSEEKKERFLNFLKEMFYHVEIKEVPSFRDSRLGEKSFQREWEDEEYELLFRIDMPNESVAKQLGRSWMSIEMKRVMVDYVTKVMGYAAEREIDVYQVDIKELVKDFLKEQNEKKLKRKEEREKANREKKEEMQEYQRLKEDIPRDEKMIGVVGSPVTKEVLEGKKERLRELKEKFEK
jgi:hypothetical protein